MKLSKRFIMRVANELINEKGTITQIELHIEISNRLGRPLSVNEKRRITQILRNEYDLARTERDNEHGGMRISYFF